jgi:hypothetical protein
MITPQYYYKKFLGGYRVFKRVSQNENETVEHFALEEQARKETYRLNGWNYKPKAK